MIFKQYYLGCLARASYLIGDASSRLAVVVDPEPETEQYVEEARLHGLQIIAVLMTDLPDATSGCRKLAALTGAQIHYSGRVSVASDGVPVQDGDAMDLGQVRLRFLQTPGPSAASLSILLYNLHRNPQNPYAILSGSTLLIGDVGRPEMISLSGQSAACMASTLWDSIQRLMAFPDATLLYPSRVVGAVCQEHSMIDTHSTLGAQRRQNYALQSPDRQKFVELMTAELPQQPELYTIEALVERDFEPGTGAAMNRATRRLSLARTLQLQRDGAQILDVRDSIEFAGAHLQGSINVGLDGRFSTWASVLLDPIKPIVLVTPFGREMETALRLGSFLGQVQGVLSGGLLALSGRSGLVDWTERVTVRTLQREMSSSKPPLVLDVRSEKEWREDGVEGSVSAPLHQLLEQVSTFSRRRRIIVVCRNGYRSSAAASLLKAQGFMDVADCVGGLLAWDAMGLNPARESERAEAA